MTKEKYLDAIRKRLNFGYRQYEVIDIISDYDSMFEEWRLEGKSDEEIIALLGSPKEVVSSLYANKMPNYSVCLLKFIEWIVYGALLYIFNVYHLQFGGSIISYVLVVSVPFSLWCIEDRSYANKSLEAMNWKHHLISLLILSLISIYNFIFVKLQPWNLIHNYGIWHCYLLYAGIIVSIGSLYVSLRQASLTHYFTFPLLFLYAGFMIQYIGFVEVLHRMDSPYMIYNALITVSLPFLLAVSCFCFMQMKRVQKWIRK